MKVIVTGASGNFGSATAERLLNQVDPTNLILLSRTPAKLARFAAAGAEIRQADFDDPANLSRAMQGGQRMLLISTARVGSRVPQHANAINAAVKAGVEHIIYTSIIAADEEANPAIVKTEHRATEKLIEASGAHWTFLRDSQYAEAIAGPMAIPALAHGSKPDNCGAGQVAFVSRDDCVATAACILSGSGHENKAYTLTGPELLSIPEALAMVSRLAGKPIRVDAVDDDSMFAYFDALGVPRHASDILPDGPIPWSSDDMVTFGQAIREGFFAKRTDHVERITGQKPKSLETVLKENMHLWPA